MGQEQSQEEEKSFEERFEEAKTEVSNQVVDGYMNTLRTTFQDARVETFGDLGNVLSESLGKIVSDVIVPSITRVSNKFEPELKRISELLETIPQIKVEDFDPESLPVTILGRDHDTCAICLEMMKEGDEVIETHCNHFFHKHCILLWFNRSHMCPLCREKQCHP